MDIMFKQIFLNFGIISFTNKEMFSFIQLHGITLSKCRYYDNNVTVTACIKSDFNVLYDNNGDLRGLFQIEDMLNIINVVAWVLFFLTHQHIRRFLNSLESV